MKLRALLFTLLASASSYAAPPDGPLLELVPARAKAAALVRRRAIQPLTDFAFADPDMMKEMRPFLEHTVGIDVTRIDGIAAFVLDGLVSDTPHAAAVLRMPDTSTAPLQLRVVGDAGGTPLYALDHAIVCARVKAGIVVGNDAAVRAAVAVDRHKEPALTATSPLGKLLSAGSDDVESVVAVAPGALPPDKTMGVDDGVLTLKKSGLIELTLHGNPVSLGVLRALATQGMEAALQSMQKEKDTALAGKDTGKGVGALVAYYQGRKTIAELTPTLDGNALRMRYQLPDLRPIMSPGVVLLSIAGAATAIAVPAFHKFTTRSKLSPAHVEVRRIASALVAAVAGGKKLATLKSSEWAPVGPCCGAANNQCTIAGAFDAPAWKAIGYAPSEDSAFRYRVRIDGKAKRATIEAEGDMDCDGAVTTVTSVVTFGSGAPQIGDPIDSGDME
jgi:hypothetical protein